VVLWLLRTAHRRCKATRRQQGVGWKGGGAHQLGSQARVSVRWQVDAVRVEAMQVAQLRRRGRTGIGSVKLPRTAATVASSSSRRRRLRPPPSSLAPPPSAVAASSFGWICSPPPLLLFLPSLSSDWAAVAVWVGEKPSRVSRVRGGGGWGFYRRLARVWLGRLHKDSGDPRRPCCRRMARIRGGPRLEFGRGREAWWPTGGDAAASVTRARQRGC
jgi:hypothetical protein